jgi:hypothetical protein
MLHNNDCSMVLYSFEERERTEKKEATIVYYILYIGKKDYQGQKIRKKSLLLKNRHCWPVIEKKAAYLYI